MFAKQLLSGLLLYAQMAAPNASVPPDLKPGHWLEVRGTLQDSHQFVAEKVTIGEPDDEAALIGTVRVDRQGRLMLLDHRLRFESDVEYQGIRRGALKGARVKVEGELADQWVFSVEEVKPRDAGRDRIEGPIDNLTQTDGQVRFDILGYGIVLTSQTEFVGFSEFALQSLPTTHAAHLFHSRFDPGSGFDDDDRFGEGLRINDAIRLTSRVVAEAAHEDNYNFDDLDNEDRDDTELSVRSRLEWQPNAPWEGVFELRYNARHRERQDRRNEDESKLDIGEAYLRYEAIAGTTATVGRQDFDDYREWLFDENLDALRISTNWAGFELDAAYGKIFSNDGSREEDAHNWMLSVAYRLESGLVTAYFIDREFADVHDEDSYHYGIRAYGQWLSSENIWLEVAKQGGDRQTRNIDALAFDVGGTWSLGRDQTWYGTIGFAYATGDDPSTNDDETFRQTGLHDNNGKFGGFTSFRYYGELSDPELSNLSISTLGLGKHVTSNLSVDLVAHYYKLDESVTELDSVEWDSDLSGEETDIGWEVDVVLGYQPFERWEVEAVLGFFDPDDAFIGTDSAWFGKLQLKFRH